MVSKRSGKSPRQFLEGAGLVLGGQRRRKETQTPGLVQGTAASSRAHSRKAAGMAQKAPIGKNGETGRPLMTRARRSRQEATRPEQQQQQQQPQPQPSRRSRQRYQHQHQHQHQHQQQAHAQYYHQPQQVQPVPRHGGVMEDLEQRLHAVHLGPAQPEFLPPQQYEAPLLQDAYLHQQQQQQRQQHQLPPEHHSQFEVHSQFEARQNSPQHQHQQYQQQHQQQQQQHQQQFFYEPRQHELYYSESGNPNPVQHLQPVSQNLYQQHQQQQELLVQHQHQLGVRPAVEHAAGPALWSLAPGHVEEQGLLHVNRVEEYYHQHHHHHHQQQQQQQYHQQHPQQDLEQQQQQQYHQQHQHQHQQLLLQHEEALLARRREAEQEERNRRGDHAEEVFPRRASPRSLPQESPLRAEDDDYGRAFYETSSRCPEGVPQLWQWQHLQRHPQLQHFHPQLREGAQQQQEGGGAGERPAQLREQFVFPLQHLEQTPERRAYQPRRQQQQQQQQQQQKVHYRIHEQNQEQEHGQPAAHLECEQGPRSQNLQGAAAVTQSLRQKNPGQNLVRNQPHSAATVEAKEARNSGEALHAHPHHDLGVPQQYVRKQGGRAEEEEGKLEEEEEEEEEEAEPETEAETALETAAAAAESKSTCARGPARKAAHKTPGPGRGEEGRARRQQTRNLAQDWQQQQQQQQQRRTYSRTASNGSTGSEASNKSGRMIAELMRRADSPRPKSVVFAESVKTYDASASLHAVNLILAVFTGQVTTSEQLLNCVPERDLRADLVVKLQRVSEALSHASAEINVNGVILTHASKKYVDRMIRDFQASINSAAPKTSAAPAVAAAVKPIAQSCKVAAATC